MKRILSLAIILPITFSATAQGYNTPGQSLLNNHEFMQIPFIILALYLAMTSVLTLIKMILDYRIKAKMIEKGSSENIVTTILQSNAKDSRNIPVKWFFILLGIGTGLLLISLFQPFGIHSLIIMTFSIAASFLGYHLFMKRSANQ